MKRPCAVMVVAASLAALLATAGELPWYGHYDQAVQLIEEGRAAQAREHLLAALEQRPEAGRMVRTYGLRYVDYLPNLYLAISCHMLGELEEARRYLERTEAAGVAAQTEVGSALLPAYRLLLHVEEGGDEPGVTAETTPSAPAEGEVSAQSGYREYSPQKPVLADAEAEELRREIGIRCGVDPAQGDPRLPWYFHYELGLAYARRGDAQRAVDELVTASDSRPQSQRGARMYGMWFTDYMPYYAIAQAHAELGNWRCVLSALERSEDMGEVPDDDAEYEAFRALLREAEAQQR